MFLHFSHQVLHFSHLRKIPPFSGGICALKGICALVNISGTIHPNIVVFGVISEHVSCPELKFHGLRSTGCPRKKKALCVGFPNLTFRKI